MFANDNKLEIEWLAEVPFLKEFSSQDLDSVAKLGSKESFAAGDVLVDQGRYGTKCYVIVTGEAIVRQNGEYVTNVGVGAMVGEMALVEHKPRNASVIADSDLVAVSFGIDEFHKLLDQQPAVKTKVLEQLNRRIADNESRK